MERIPTVTPSAVGHESERLTRRDETVERSLLTVGSDGQEDTPFLQGEGVSSDDRNAWDDEHLVAAIRRDPPDEAALEALATRYWKALYGRCELMTLNRQTASDLAQEAWCKVLRTRHRLKPGGNFAAYLSTVALNIWRDRCRADRRAGAMSDRRMTPLDGEISTDDGETIMLADVLPDLEALEAERQQRLKHDIDHALEQLHPELRGVIVARFLACESCAEIGRRHGRTEQTISAWVRRALRELKLHLEERDGGPAPKPEL